MSSPCSVMLSSTPSDQRPLRKPRRSSSDLHADTHRTAIDSLYLWPENLYPKAVPSAALYVLMTVGLRQVKAASLTTFASDCRPRSCELALHLERLGRLRLLASRQGPGRRYRRQQIW
jgi:hypothetical protein